MNEELTKTAGYLVYDGVDFDVHFCDTEEDAKKELQELIDSSLDDDGVWMSGVELSCIAKLTHVVSKKEIKTPEDYRRDSGISKWCDMTIKGVDE